MKLTKLQQQILTAVGHSQLADFFYWTGGTLLSACYLQHRWSEDLDFFSQDLISEEVVLAGMNNIKKSLGLSRLRQTIKLNRQQYQLQKNGEWLKLEFVYFPFPPLSKPKKVKEWPIKIDSLVDLAVNKIFALYERGEPKDAVDIYYIWQRQNWRLEKLIERANKKFGIELDPAMLASRALEAADRLPAITPLFPRKINLKKLQNNIESLFSLIGKKYLSRLLS